MGTRETKPQRGRRRGTQIAARVLSELRETRVRADISQRTTAGSLGWSVTQYWRFENGYSATSFIDVSAVASIFGLELSVGLHPVGEPIRDKGHQALIARLRAELSPAFKVLAEVPLPTPGDRRSWDLLLRLPAQLIGVEAETRIRDVQQLTRHVHQREREGGVDEIVLLLAATRTNRELVDELRIGLGPGYTTSPRLILRALRTGHPVPGSGVVLL